MLGKLDKQVNRLSSLISDLLDVTKIHTGRLQFNETEFDFNTLVEEVIEDVQHTSSKHQIKKELRFKGMMIGDTERISQVITNLLTNAIKYSPDANEIIIYTKETDGQVQLCLQDFGIGISAHKKDLVFEQFYRVSGSKQHTFPGLGLGLYISSEIIKRLNGRIWVNSVEGKGSTFCFSLPIRTSA
jgi:signal transduction histidine kinase